MIVDAMWLAALLTLGVTSERTFGPASSGEVFVGSTPCGHDIRRFVGIAPKAPCEFMTWTLVLATDGTSRIRLAVVYGVGVPNQPGFENGGTTRQLTGSWIERRERDATTGSVYRLAIDGRRMDFRKLGEHLLHPVNSQGTLMVGTAGWSYTLSAENPSPTRHQRLSLEPVTGGLPSLAGVFEGRTPCAALAPRLAIGAESGCNKLKWRLTLHQDPVTHTPSHYVLEGTAFRQAARTGRWSIVRSRTDPTRLIYRLDSDGHASFLSLARADEHVLLFVDDDGVLLTGNSYFSYTLNRSQPSPPRPLPVPPGESAPPSMLSGGLIKTGT